MKIICISGKAQHGKDTLARMLKKQLELDKQRKILIAHYGDLIKYVCRQFFGWNGKKDERGRSLLQYVGTEVVRKQIPDFWVKFIADILTMFRNEWDYVIIPDCRFPEEIDIFKERELNSVSLRIERGNFTSPLTKEQQLHPSETSLDNYLFDYYIYNDAKVEQLLTAVEKFADDLPNM